MGWVQELSLPGLLELEDGEVGTQSKGPHQAEQLKDLLGA